MNNSYFIRKTLFEFESSLKGYLAIKCKKKTELIMYFVVKDNVVLCCSINVMFLNF